MIESIVRWLNANPYVALTATLVGVISFPFGIWQYLKQIKERRPYWLAHHQSIVIKSTKTFPNLTLHWKGKAEDITDFAISRFVLWNGGKETIRIADVTAEPIQIKAKDNCTILACEILKFTHSTNSFGCKISKDKKIATVDFEYMDYGQGVAIEVSHDGASPDSVEIDGVIMGVGHIINAERLNASRMKRFLRFNRFTYLTVIIGSLIAMLFSAPYEDPSHLIEALEARQNEITSTIVDLNNRGIDLENRSKMTLEELRKLKKEVNESVTTDSNQEKSPSDATEPEKHHVQPPYDARKHTTVEIIPSNPDQKKDTYSTKTLLYGLMAITILSYSLNIFLMESRDSRMINIFSFFVRPPRGLREFVPDHIYIAQ